MSKEKYCLSPQFEFVDTIFGSNSDTIKLLNKKNGEILLINSVIASFLKIFEQPATFNNALNYFKNETQGTASQLKPIIKDFFESMLNRDILISESELVELSHKPIMPNSEGQYLDDYLLLKQLSRTSPIGIYLACNGDNQKFIIKKIYFAPNYPQKYIPKNIKTFAHEFKILQQLRGGEGICQLIKYEKKNHYAVIEHFEGISLRKRIEEKSHILSLNDKIGIFKQILKTLNYIHSKEIVHGDIHYSNILVNDKNDIKVIDFDLALHISEIGKDNIMRGGIKDFLPPERINFNAFEVFNDPPDFRAEVFQLGVLGYYIFYETLPFKGDTWKAMANEIIFSDPDWKLSNLSSDIQNILKKALSKKSENRFHSCIEMFEAYQLAIDNKVK